MLSNIEYIKNKFDAINLPITDLQAEKLYKYYNLLIEKNKVMNLTSITEFEDVVLKHFIDSTIILKKVDIELNSYILDMGTGAGFPGIPLLIIRDDLNLVLADSLNKRVLFLKEVIEQLDLNNVTVIHTRAEDLARNKLYREKFDFCLSRAVANLSTLSEYCIPFIKVDGYFIPYKSGNIDEELNNAKKAISILGCNTETVINYELPFSDMERSFVVIKKVKSTSNFYPRKSGVPSKTPL